MKANSLSQSAIILLESAVLEMTVDSQKIFTGLDNLLNYRLSMEIVDGQDMEVEFNGLQQALRQEGFERCFKVWPRFINCQRHLLWTTRPLQQL